MGFVLSLLLLCAPMGANAAEFGLGEQYSLLHGQTVKSDLYVAGGMATLVGNVLGDASLFGGNVFVGSAVSGNVNLVGGTVDVIGGTIGQNIRIASGKSLIRTVVEKDIVIASGNLELLDLSIVSGDVDIAVGKAVLGGEIKGGVRGVAGNLTINGIVRGDVRVTADNITLGPNAEIDGSFIYSSSKPATIAQGAVIKKENTFTQVDTRSRAERLVPTLWGTWILIKFIILLVSALVIQGIFQSISKRLVRTALESPKWSIVRGFLVLVAVPCALTLVLLTFIGIPFVILGGSAYVLFMMLAYLFSPIVLGSLIFKYTQKNDAIVTNWKSIVTGVCAFMILSPLSWFGTAIQSILFLVTLGAIYHVLFEQFIRAREY